MNWLQTNIKDKNVRDLYRGIKEFKNGYQPWAKMAEYNIVISLNIP
jgi:hypothetical protein